MRIAGRELKEFSVCAEADGVCASYAAGQLRHYIKIALGVSLDIVSERRPSRQIVLRAGSGGDGFRGFCSGGSFCLEGDGERGLLYAVYDFLERFVGWRFFASRMQFRGVECGAYMAPVEKVMHPARDIAEGTRYAEAPGIAFRDFFGHAAADEDWCAKNRINGDLWRLKNTPDYMGGTESFASQGGHTFSELLPADVYYKEHPEYYSLVDGRRVADSQICFTNENVFREIVKNCGKILRRNPGAKYISVSQNDNSLWCTCEKCAAAVGGVSRLLFDFVNRVASALESEFPHVKIHTFAYDDTARDVHQAFHRNVVVQYCLRSCRGHTLSDPGCKANAAIAGRLKMLSSRCRELFIYDYLSSEAHILQFMPDIFRLRDNVRFLADCNVRGVYSEMDIFNQNSPCMEELRAYVYSKLMWNPYMSAQEYDDHINEFLQGYYGKGWKHIRRYLEIWAEETDGAHYDSVLGNVADDDGHDVIGRDGIPVRCAFMPEDRVNEACRRLEDELRAAEALAGPEETDRVRILRAGTLWYRLYHTMQGAADRERMIADNRELCSLMRRYCMKYTWSIGMSETTAMYKDFTLAPKDWNYWEKNSGHRVFGSRS